MRRRHEPAHVKFLIQKILGQVHESQAEEFDEEMQLEIEMQHILAAAITKILDQKSIRESVANLPRLIVDELEDQIRD